jgi:HlyD family secretion protein
MIKKILKSKIFWLITLIVIGLAGYTIYMMIPEKDPYEYTFSRVEKGLITQTVTATGVVESANEISLNFKVSGKIVNLTVEEGDKVKAGEVLASLDSSAARILVNQYRANLASAQANLNKVKSGASSEDVALTNQQLSKAQNDYTNLIRDSEVQASVLTEKIIDNLNNSIFTSQASLNSIFNDLVNNETTYNLQVADDGIKNKVINNYFILREEFDFIRLQVEGAKNNQQDKTRVIATAELMRNYLSKLNDFFNDAYVLSDKIIINSSYSQLRKDQIRAGVGTQQAAINSVLSSVQLSRTNLINYLSSYQTQIQSASNSVAVVQAQLNLKTAAPRDFDIATAQAQVAQAQSSLDKVLLDLEDFEIKAPIDGIITKVYYSRGENAISGQPIVNMLGNDKYEVKIDVPESDITKIKIGERAIIELDAFGSDYRFGGVITFIDPAQTVIRDVTYYKIKVSFDDETYDETIKPGMTANITIISKEKNDALYIPQRAVRIRETTLDQAPQRFVEILVDGQVVEKPVLVGLRGDNGLVEVVDGLVEGQEIIVSRREK